jgi:PIN domain nuclease of toxin-antitoxin system
MKFLLDTSTFLWMITDDKKLSKKAKNIIIDGENELFFSSVSAWEISIKYKLGKLNLPDSPEIFIPEQIKSNFLIVLPLYLSHALSIYNLPDIHKDPFDRMLISQAKQENLVILTTDSEIEKYNVKVVW